MKNIFLWLCFAFCFCACEDFMRKPHKLSIYGSNQPNKYTIRFVSRKPLSEIFSKEHYRIKASFPEDHSKLILFSHFQGFELENGIKLTLQRDESQLLIKLSVQAYPDQVLFEGENYFLNNNEVDFTIEVENGTNYGFRVRIWENFLNRKGIVKQPASFLTGENLIADSLSEDLTFYDKGQGLKWGLELLRVRLIEGSRVSPRVL